MLTFPNTWKKKLRAKKAPNQKNKIQRWAEKKRRRNGWFLQRLTKTKQFMFFLMANDCFVQEGAPSCTSNRSPWENMNCFVFVSVEGINHFFFFFFCSSLYFLFLVWVLFFARNFFFFFQKRDKKNNTKKKITLCRKIENENLKKNLFEHEKTNFFSLLVQKHYPFVLKLISLYRKHRTKKARKDEIRSLTHYNMNSASKVKKKNAFQKKI